jgi:hypothetical protein
MARVGRIRVSINPTAMAAWLETNGGAQSGLATSTKAIEAQVQQAAPVGVSLSWPKKLPGERWIRRPMKHGRFKKSIHAEKTRGGWRVLSDDPFAWLIEWGSVKNHPYSVFRRVMVRYRHDAHSFEQASKK